MPAERARCGWAGDDPLMQRYHDEDWGVPLHDDRALFELLTLEGVQAGLSWLTVLRRRETYRVAFDDFEIAKVAAYGDSERERLLGDPGIIRNRAKVASAIVNAQGVLAIQEECGSFDAYLWSFVGGETRRNAVTTLTDLPAETDASKALSKALRKRGFSFVGPTICYAFMQSAGLVNDHTPSCYRYGAL